MPDISQAISLYFKTFPHGQSPMQALNGIQATIDCRPQCKCDDSVRPSMGTTRTQITSFLQLPMLDDWSEGHLYFGTQSDVFSLFTLVALFF